MPATPSKIEPASPTPSTGDAEQLERPAAVRRPLSRHFIVEVVAAVLAVAALVAARGTWKRWFASAAPSNVVVASGRIEGRDVTIAPKDIQGRVSQLFVDEGQMVTRGQLLAVLEAKQLEARASSLTASIGTIDAQIAQASLDVNLTDKNSDASIAASEAAVSVARARIARAKAVAANASAEFDRATMLFKSGVASGREMDQAEMSLRTSEADVDAAAKDLARAEADLALARASKDSVVVKRQQVRALQQTRRSAVGQLAEVQAYLAERQVVAPSDGTILSRPVEVGDVVSPGSPMFELVDMNRLYVKVYVPEPDIPKLRLGDPADVSVDAFPGRRFTARISKIHDQAEFTPKNVETADERLKLVFGVELALVNTDRLLKPGMPADCVIHWNVHTDTSRHAS
jgi:HlyD family secretion protein